MKIFAMDVGNTNIKTALFDGDEMLKYWRISTNHTYTSDEYGIVLHNLFTHEGLSMNLVDRVIISSVVPTVNFTLEHMCQDYFKKDPMFVVPGIKTGINIKYENPRELGSDRIANAVGAFHQYGGPCIFIDFGTATTFGVVDEKGSFLGGCICPGIKLASEAIVSGASKLPRFELVKPPSIIGKNTVTNLQAGLIYGYVGQVNYIVKKMKQELGRKDVFVVATGGLALLVAGEANAIDKLDGFLTLKGLRIISHLNADSI